MIATSFDSARAGFFDTEKVLKSLDRASRQALSKFGAFVRTRARSSIRTRKTISPPGSPPSSHTGTYKKLIFFSYDAGAKSVVIGPTQAAGKRGDAPALLEHGGAAEGGRGRPARYRARPVMGPAFEAELPKAPGQWADSVKA